MEKIISQSERELLLKYLPNMETAKFHRWTKAIPTSDRRVLQELYKRHVNPHFAIKLFCNYCAIQSLSGLYDLAKKIQAGEI